MNRFDITINEDGTYTVNERIVYQSLRYGKVVTVPAGMVSDGATDATDIASMGWIVHDRLCDTGCWDDGTPISNWQCSQVLQDILNSEGRRVRAITWFWATLLCGGGKARKNGIFSVRAA